MILTKKVAKEKGKALKAFLLPNSPVKAHAGVRIKGLPNGTWASAFNGVGGVTLLMGGPSDLDIVVSGAFCDALINAKDDVEVTGSAASVQVTYGKSKVSIPTWVETDEFPAFVTAPEGSTMEVSRDDLEFVAENVSCITSDAHPTVVGRSQAFMLNGNSMLCIAADSVRASAFTLDVDNKDGLAGYFVVSAKNFVSVVNSLTSDDINISFGKRAMVIEDGEDTYSLVYMSENYPAVHSLFDQKGDWNKLDGELIGAMKECASMGHIKAKVGAHMVSCVSDSGSYSCETGFGFAPPAHKSGESVAFMNPALFVGQVKLISLEGSLTKNQLFLRSKDGQWLGILGLLAQ